MNKNTNPYQPHPMKKYPPRRNAKVLVGVIIIIIGIAFLLNNLIPSFPGWIFSWPIFLLALGLIIGARNDFKGNTWWILTLLGIIFFVDRQIYSMVIFKPFIFPIILIAVGLLMIMRSRKKQALMTQQYSSTVSSPYIKKEKEDESLLANNINNTAENNNDEPQLLPPVSESKSDSSSYEENKYYSQGYQDFLQVNSYFGGNTTRVISKSFKGGSITCMFAGAEVDLGQADFEGLIFIDIFTAFGGTEIYIPGDWNVVNEITSLLGGVEDKRRFAAGTNSKKTLVLKGTVMFGSVEIKNS